MKSLLTLFGEAACDMSALCSVDTARDVEYVTRRYENEGLPFLAVRLATFGKDFQKSLDQGFVAADSFLSFKRRAGLPELFKGFLQHVFDPNGVILPSPNHLCIIAVRQLTLMFEKVRIDYDRQVVDAAMEGYMASERNVKELDRKIQSGLLDPQLALFEQVANILWADTLQSVEEDVLNGHLVPRHGPGSTAEKLLGNEKWTQTEWPVRLDEWFPHQEYLVPSLRYWREATEYAAFLAPEQERPVRVITVPKTVGKARIIAMEPAAMQYCQQAVFDSLTKNYRRSIGSFFYSHDDQIPNQLLAEEGSVTGKLATLDLSAASDSLSNQLVLRFLGRYPALSSAVQACRSKRADVPGHGVIRLSKFASMGSALCFPLETMVFVTLAVMGSLVDRNGMNEFTRVRRSEILDLVGQVRTFGDDIIVPTSKTQSVIDWLETFGFTVNQDKSFWTGKFRESCGKDYYDGTDVSVVRVRADLPASRSCTSEILATVSLRNRLYLAGMWHSAMSLDPLLEKLLRGRYPNVGLFSSVLGRISFSPRYFSEAPRYDVERVNTSLQCEEVNGWVVKPILPSCKIEGLPALMKCIIDGNYLSNDLAFHKWDWLDGIRRDPSHLDQDGRPLKIELRLRWRQPY